MTPLDEDVWSEAHLRRWAAEFADANLAQAKQVLRLLAEVDQLRDRGRWPSYRGEARHGGLRRMIIEAQNGTIEVEELVQTIDVMVFDGDEPPITCLCQLRGRVLSGFTTRPGERFTIFCPALKAMFLVRRDGTIASDGSYELRREE